MEAWNKINVVPDNARFVLLILQDGTAVEAQWIEKVSIFRTGKQWIGRDGKYQALTYNPAIEWQELKNS